MKPLPSQSNLSPISKTSRLTVLPNQQIFRILGDVSHTLSKCILIYAIHSNHSAEGVSLITQALYCLVFISRYLDLFTPYSFLLGSFTRKWIFTLKIFYILSSLYILFLMMRVYARTREREKAWKLGALVMVGSIVGAPFMMMVSLDKSMWGLMEVCPSNILLLSRGAVLTGQ